MTGFHSVNPYTGEVLGHYPFISDQEISNKIADGQKVYYTYWKKLSVNKRSKLIKPISGYLRENKFVLGELISREMGKPVRESVSEIEKVAWMIDFHCDNASKFLKDKKIEAGYTSSYISFEPLGGVLGIMPWNFPFWQVFRFAVPAMLAGNMIFVKHAPNVPLCALEIEKIFTLFLPNCNVYQNLFIDINQVEQVIAHNFIQGVSLTGSEKAGSIVGSLAGKNIKKSVLELGGTDPFIICDDADLPKAIEQFIISRMSNNGQICIAAKRLLVQEGIYDQVKEMLIEKISSLKSGDPLDPSTQISCLARPDLKRNLTDQIEKLKFSNAKFLYGAVDSTATGCSPIVIEIDKTEMIKHDEEIFGPVALLTKFASVSEIPGLVNSSRYGLAVSLWTRDMKTAGKLIKDIETGTIAVNKMVASDPRIPFGGIKKSGFGREMAEIGIKEFVNIKSVVIN